MNLGVVVQWQIEKGLGRIVVYSKVQDIKKNTSFVCCREHKEHDTCKAWVWCSEGSFEKGRLV